MMKNHVLVLTDGSDFARQIFPHITRYLPPEYNDLILLRVDEEPHGHIGAPARPASGESKVMMYERRADFIEAQHPIYASQEWASANAALERSMQEDAHLLRLAGYDVTIDTRFDHRVAEAIARYVETHDVDLIAMTTHGRTGFTRMMFGSVAQHLMSHVDIPIMILRTKTGSPAREE
jgi:nucleotide-binding universal stress UspA family protein